MPAPVLPIGLTMVGGYLAWFAVHYWRDAKVVWPSDPVKSLLTKGSIPPHTASASPTIDTTPIPTSGTTEGTGDSAIAQQALKYVGAGYRYGGNASAVGDWDCSSFVSYVLGHDLGVALPGGKWGGPGMPPATHGPTTVTYLVYGSPLARKEVSAGDLVVWQTHMGIATSNTEMVSARNEASGVGVDKIDGFMPDEVASYRRVTVDIVNPYHTGDTNPTPPTPANPGGTITGPAQEM